MDKVRFYLKSHKTELALSAMVLTIGILGARLQVYQLGMATIALICLILILLAFDKIKPSAYPIVIYVVALTLLFMTTLYSNGLVGTDIHLEYYFAQLAAEQGWDASIPYLNNSAFGLVLLAPWLSEILHIEVLWILKIIFPMLFALTPLILYFVFKHWVTPKQALLAAFFFMIVPTYFMELTGIARQQIAELFLAACLYLIVVSKFRLRWKLPLVVLSGLMVVVSHYSLGPIIIFILLIACIVQWILKTDIKFPAWAFAVVVCVLMVCSIGYYHFVAGGMPLRYMTAHIPVEQQTVGPFVIGPMYPPFPPEEIVAPPGSDKALWELDQGMSDMTGLPYFANHEVLMQAAIGMDFVESTTWGKAFRILQYITQVAVVVGLIILYKKRSYYVLATSAVLLLLLCVFVPGVSAILNATRFYHIGLFALAPAFIMGSKFIFRNLKIVVICIMIPYLLFTSGFVYEASKNVEISKIDIPYLAPLSNHRVDFGANPTLNDIAVREWIANNDIEVLYTDFYGVLFLQEVLGTKEILRLREDWIKTGSGWKSSDTHITDMGIPKGAYIFLRGRGTVAFWSGIGTRRIYTREEIGLDSFGEVAFKAGNSEVRVVVD